MTSSWQTAQFKNFCDITRGASPRPIHDYLGDEGMPWIKIADATAENSRYISRTKEKIKLHGVKASVEVFPGDLILSNSATPGLPKFLKINACIHDGWMLLRNFRNLDIEFAYWLLLAERVKLVAQGNGSVFTNLKTYILKSHFVTIPPVDEQRKIARLLNALDDKITLLRETSITLESIAQALFKSWFVDFDPVRTRQDIKCAELIDEVAAEIFPNTFDQSTSAVIPQGWHLKKMEDVSSVGIGKTPPRKEQQWFSQDSKDIRWVSIRDMGDFGVYTLDTSEFITKEAVNQFNVRIVPDNTVIMSFKMTIGRVAITDGEMTTNEAIAHFKLEKESTISSQYIYLHLKQFNFSELSSTSSIADAVNSKTVRQIPILIPSLQVMSAFQEKVEPIFNLLKNYAFQIQTLTNLRDTLLPRLISGQIRLPDLVEEIGATTTLSL